MYIELTAEEYAIFKQLREGGITRNASILQILDTCDSFECVEESGEEEEYDEQDNYIRHNVARWGAVTGSQFDASGKT